MARSLSELAGPRAAPLEGGSALASASIWHPAMLIAFTRIVEFLGSPSDRWFALLVGPAGAGKSKLLEAIRNERMHKARIEMLADPNLIPVVSVKAPAPAVNNGTFAWLTFADRIADQLAPTGPLVEGILPGRNQALGRTVRQALDGAARLCVARGVEVILVEEARHLAMVANKRRPAEGLHVLKEFSLSTNARFVLAGTYGLLDFRAVSAEIGRRTKPVHLKPYDSGVARERAAFEGVAREMLGLIGAPESGIEDVLLETLLERSGGAIGILRDWLVDAEYAMRCSPGLDLGTAIADAGPDDVTVRQAAAEITDGLVRLGLAPQLGVVIDQEPAADNRARTASGQRLKVGERGPARRDIGIPDVA